VRLAGEPALASALLSRCPVARTLAEIQADLVARGVDAALARRLATAIEKRTAALDVGRYQGVIAGIALVVAAQRREVEQLRKAADELGEMRRLLGNFTDELEKLDEALETLAAYVLRMKNPQPAPPSRRVLH
jgi:hypothetical protein